MNLNIPFTISNVSEIAIAPINADATLQAGGAGNRMVFGGVVNSPKGRPFEVLAVNAVNWSAILGRPEHSSKGNHTESLRQLAEAVNGGAGYVVRVVPSDFKFPVLTLSTVNVEPSKKEKTSEVGLTVDASALPFGAEIEQTATSALSLWVVDGDPSTNRFVSMTKADAEVYGEGMFELVLVEQDAAGNETELEKHFVSMKVDSKDDMGRPAFIETVLESRSAYLNAKVGTMKNLVTEFPKSKFIGGTNGDLNNIAVEDYEKAFAILSSSVLQFDAMVSLGIYNDSAIRTLANICDGRRIRGFVDIDPRLTYAEALEKATSMALNRERISLYHLPYTYVDPIYGNRVMAGISGIAFTAKAKGVAKTSPVGGWHYTAAGEERAIIGRSGLRIVNGVGEPDYALMYKHRINKVAANATGMLFIDDSLTTYVRENYLRFEQCVDVTDKISREFFQLGNQIKHSPDGITFDGLVGGMIDILDGYVATGALVSPRDPSEGKEPYRLIVEQVEIDLWNVRFSICVSGSSRRITGEPILLR